MKAERQSVEASERGRQREALTLAETDRIAARVVNVALQGRRLPTGVEREDILVWARVKTWESNATYETGNGLTREQWAVQSAFWSIRDTLSRFGYGPWKRPWDLSRIPVLACEMESDQWDGGEDFREACEARVMASQVLAFLKPQESVVFRLRYFENLTNAEVGVRIGRSEQRVSQILNRTPERVREALG